MHKGQTIFADAGAPTMHATCVWLESKQQSIGSGVNAGALSTSDKCTTYGLS